MERIGMVAANLVDQVSQPKSTVDNERALTVRRRSSTMPATLDRTADMEIPRMVLDPWKEVGRPQGLRRLPTDHERAIVERRRDELAPWVAPYHSAELDDVAISISEMFDAFPAMVGRSDAGLVAKVNSLARVMAEFPAWAIVRVCDRIRTRGYVKSTPDGYVTERHWPPSDAEIIEVVGEEVKIYRRAYDGAVALLTAEVRT